MEIDESKLITGVEELHTVYDEVLTVPCPVKGCRAAIGEDCLSQRPFKVHGERWFIAFCVAVDRTHPLHQ